MTTIFDEFPPKNLDVLSNKELLECLLKATNELSSGYGKYSFDWADSVDRFRAEVIKRMEK